MVFNVNRTLLCFPLFFIFLFSKQTIDIRYISCEIHFSIFTHFTMDKSLNNSHSCTHSSSASHYTHSIISFTAAGADWHMSRVPVQPAGSRGRGVPLSATLPPPLHTHTWLNKLRAFEQMVTGAAGQTTDSVSVTPDSTALKPDRGKHSDVHSSHRHLSPLLTPASSRIYHVHR